MLDGEDRLFLVANMVLVFRSAPGGPWGQLVGPHVGPHVSVHLGREEKGAKEWGAI